MKNQRRRKKEVDSSLKTKKFPTKRKKKKIRENGKEFEEVPKG
jgi:hypothetical protein